MAVAEDNAVTFSVGPPPKGTGAVVPDDPTPTVAVASFAASGNKQRCHVGESYDE